MMLMGCMAAGGPHLAAAGGLTKADAFRSGWADLIPKIQTAERDELILEQVRLVDGFGKLPTLDTLVSPDIQGFPLDNDTRVVAVHNKLLEEVLCHPSLYRNNTAKKNALGILPFEADYFYGTSPQRARVSTQVRNAVWLHTHVGDRIGQAVICAGGAQCLTEAQRLKDGTRISASTVKGNRTKQQDSIYYAFYQLPSGHWVKIIAGSDGMGGHSAGDVASGAFLLGIHTAVVKAARNEQVPYAYTLFKAGARILRAQKGHRTAIDDAGATGSVAVIYGDSATIATAGDSMLTWSRLDDSDYMTKGYSHADCIGRPSRLSATVKSSPHIYKISKLRPGDRLTVGSDGFWENILGTETKIRASSDLRLMFGERAPVQEDFDNLNFILNQSSGHLLSAKLFVDLSLRDMMTVMDTFGITNPFAYFRWKAVRDNVFVIDYEHPALAESAAPFGSTDDHSLLEPVF